MRRRIDDPAGPPQELLVFEGFQFRTEESWTLAYSAWCDARDAWLSRHGLALHVDLPKTIDGDCPVDLSSI